MQQTSQKDSRDGRPAPPPDEGSIEYVKQYIDASAESADRARFVLLVMVTASVLAYVAIWNSRPASWPTARLSVATSALLFYDAGDTDKRRLVLDDGLMEQQVWPRFFSQQVYDGKDEQQRRAYLAARRAEFDGAKAFVKRSFVEQTRFADLEHLRRYIDYLERARAEKVLSVTVPFFGIVFDINDLGMFAGFTFVIVLLLFRYSRLRELRNVRLVFRQARTVEHLELCYNMLAMQQVLTIPPQLDRGQSGAEGWRERFWVFVPKLLALLPLLAQLRIFIHDWRTYETVEKVYPGTMTGLALSSVFLALNILLTVICVNLGLKVDKTWANHARYIIKHRVRPAEERDVEETAEGEEGKADGDPRVDESPADGRRAEVKK